MLTGYSVDKRPTRSQYLPDLQGKPTARGKFFFVMPNIKFVATLRKSSQEIHEMLRTVYGNNALGKTDVFKLIKVSVKALTTACMMQGQDDCRHHVLM